MTQTPDFERRIYEALAEEAAATGWNQADAYLKRHAADHAAASGQLDDLISQQDFLSNTDPSTLAPHLRRPLDSRAGQLGAVFRAGIDLHREATDHRARAQRLLIDHSRAGFSEPANVGDAASLWRPAWCIGSQLHPAQLDVLQRSDNVRAVAFGQVAGRPVAITSSEDQTVRVWDLDTGEQRSVMTGHTREVSAVAFGQAAGHPVAITGSGDRTVRVWDLDTGA
ncbi:hypothetical protein AB0I03_17760, partial [Glycomyces sp. NPDC021274]